MEYIKFFVNNLSNFGSDFVERTCFVICKPSKYRTIGTLQKMTYFDKVFIFSFKKSMLFLQKNIKYTYTNTTLEGGWKKVALDKILIGARVRKIREELLEEPRANFARRCNLTYRHIAQIERGEFLVSLPTLDKIAEATGVDTDYILYGKNENKLKIKETLNTLIDRADKEELEMYYKCITTIKNYVNKKEKNNW